MGPWTPGFWSPFQGFLDGVIWRKSPHLSGRQVSHLSDEGVGPDASYHSVLKSLNRILKSDGPPV